MELDSNNYVLVLGSKPFSKLPFINVKKVYCANGAAERCIQYKSIFKDVETTSVVSASEFNKRPDVRNRVIKLKPDNIFCRFGTINNKFLKYSSKTKIRNLGKFEQLVWQSKFFKYGIITLFFSEFNYENFFLKKIKHLIDCFLWRGFLGSSTGLFSILLAHIENPYSKILVSGIGIKTGGKTFYGSNENKTLRSNVDKILFLYLNKKIKEKIITTDFEMSEFCRVALWDKDLIN